MVVDDYRKPAWQIDPLAARGNREFDVNAQGYLRLLRPDVGLADDAGKVVMLLAKKRCEFQTAHPNRMEPLACEFCHDITRFKRCHEPAGKLGHDFLRCLRGRCYPIPEVRLRALVAIFGNG